jgi:geranylgeranyl diphosphate synthase, type II
MSGVMLNPQLDEFLGQQAETCTRLLGEIAARLPGNSVGQAMAYALHGGGKRLRPALCVATYRAFGRDENEAVHKLAAAIEIIHTYSLVHDDLPCMDDDSFRRGRETTHRVFGDRVAMLAGAALIPLAFGIAREALDSLGADAARQRAIHLRLATAAGASGMVGGQVADIEGAASLTTTVELERIHAAKTGALITAACVIGAQAADASQDAVEAIEQYGRHLGLAFQITDDVLDETASTADLGKTAGPALKRPKLLRY